MEQTNLASFKRLSGLGFFKGTDGLWVPLGNILGIKLDTAPKSVAAMLNKRGHSTLARRDNYGVEPVWSITCNQFFTSVIPLFLMGNKLADVVQASNTAQTKSFTAKAGKRYNLGVTQATITTVKVSAATKVLGTDYFVDDPNITQSLFSQNGDIILPETLAGIADGDTFIVTYDQAAVTREQYNAFSVLNRSGTLQVIAENELGADPDMIWTAQCQLSVKSTGDMTVDKFTEVVLEAAIFGSPIITFARGS